MKTAVKNAMNFSVMFLKEKFCILLGSPRDTLVYLLGTVKKVTTIDIADFLFMKMILKKNNVYERRIC